MDFITGNVLWIQGSLLYLENLFNIICECVCIFQKSLWFFNEFDYPTKNKDQEQLPENFVIL